MSLDSASVVATLTRGGLLEEGRLAVVARDLLPRAGDARSLIDELVRRGWLTSYQGNRLLEGRSEELLLGQHVVLEKLGEGGMGQVLKVRHRGLDRVQVLKLIRPALLGSPQALLRFQREARAAARLAHANIVTVHDAGIIEGSGAPFLALEYVAGTDLHRQVAQTGPLPFARACEHIRQAALGLQHAHDRGLIHRDIKPANLLLAEGNQVVKVADFGLASLSSTAEGGLGPLTAEGAVIGTPDYMAPEQALRAGAVDGRADVYSLGCTLYFLLTGRPPFPGGSAAQKLLAHQQSEPADLRQLRADLPGELVSVVRRMMAKRPEERYQTPAEAAAALAPFCGCEQEPLAAPPTAEIDSAATSTLTPGEQPPVRRRRLTGKGLAAGVLLMGVLLAVVVWLLNRPGDKNDKGGDGRPTPHQPDREAGPIAADERFSWQPKELVAVLGSHRWRHWGQVYCVAFSPDGKLLASGGGDQVIRLWDMTSAGRSPRDRILKGHKGPVNVVAFSPDGKLLVSAGEDAVGLWDVATGKRLAELAGFSAYAVTFSKQYLAAAGGDSVIRLWDLTTVRESSKPAHLLVGHQKDVNALAFSPDGHTLVSGDRRGVILRWQLHGNRQPEKKELHTSPSEIMCLAFSPTQEVLAVGGRQHLLELLDANGTVLANLKGHSGDVVALAFSSDGQMLATASADSDIRLWDAKSKYRESKILVRGRFSANALVFNPRDSQLLVSGGVDGVVRRWNTATHLQQPLGPGHAGAVLAVAFSPDGRRLASVSEDHTVRLWEVASWQGRELPAETAAVTAVAFSSDGKRLAAGDSNGIILLWEVPEMGTPARPARMERPGNGTIHTLAFAPDNVTLAVGGAGSELELWNIGTRKRVSTLPGHSEEVWAVAFTSQVTYARVATTDGSTETPGHLRVWPWPIQGKKPEIFTGPKGGRRVVTFAPNGKAVASAGADNRVRVWKLGEEDRPVLECEAQPRFVKALTYTPDGRFLISANEAGQVILWDASSGSRRGGWQLPGAVYGLAVAADGRFLALANSNGTVYVLRLPNRPAE